MTAARAKGYGRGAEFEDIGSSMLVLLVPGYDVPLLLFGAEAFQQRLVVEIHQGPEDEYLRLDVSRKLSFAAQGRASAHTLLGHQ